MDLIRESLGITIVFALLWGAIWFLKKRGAIAVGPRVHLIEVIDKVRLTPQHSVHVLRIADRELVVGVHSSGFTVLAEQAKACSTRSS